MIKRLNAKNANEVNALMRDPENYPFIIDDSCPPPEEFDAIEILKDQRTYVLGWHKGGLLVGLWFAVPWNAIMYQAHICMSSAYRGKATVEATEDAIRWMFQGTKCRKVIALVPDYHIRMKMTMKALGFEREGKLRNSFLKDGKLVDEVIYGLCKGGGE